MVAGLTSPPRVVGEIEARAGEGCGGGGKVEDAVVLVGIKDRVKRGGGEGEPFGILLREEIVSLDHSHRMTLLVPEDLIARDSGSD
jgi:hypothetical protein